MFRRFLRNKRPAYDALCKAVLEYNQRDDREHMICCDVTGTVVRAATGGFSYPTPEIRRLSDATKAEWDRSK